MKRKATHGFHTMDPHVQRNIASMGGKVCHALGRAHKFTVEEAKAAGQKGGLANKRRRIGAKITPREG